MRGFAAWLVRRLFKWFRLRSRRNGSLVLDLGGGDALHFRDFTASGGLMAFGGSGSAKTTSLANGEIGLLAAEEQPGAFWVCVKPSECARAKRQAERAGRAHHVIEFSPESGLAIDLADVVLNAPGGNAQTLAQFLDYLNSLTTRASGGGEEKMWTTLGAHLRLCAIRLIQVARQRVGVRLIHDIIATCATSPKQAESEAWRESACYKALFAGGERWRLKEMTEAEAKEYEELRVYFKVTLPGFGDRFAGSVKGTAIAPLVPLVVPPFGEIFSSGRTTLHLDALEAGAIIIANFPVLTWHAAGQLAMAAVTMLIQMWALRRQPGARPVVIFRDELPWTYLPEWDEKVILVSRGSGLIHLDIAQDMRALIGAGGGGMGAEHQVKSFVNQHGLYFLFANADIDCTNKHFSELLGQTKEWLFGTGTSRNPDSGVLDQFLGSDNGYTANAHESRYYRLPPEAFASADMRRGGAINKFLADCYVLQPGKRFAQTGHSYRRVTFRQVLD